MIYRGILFDKDGTLLALHQNWVKFYLQILKEHCHIDDQAAENLMVKAGFNSLTKSFQPHSLLAAGTTAQLVALWWPDLHQKERAEKIALFDDNPTITTCAQPLALSKELSPILTQLRAQGLKLGIATNDTERSARSHMGELGLTHFFEMILGADSVSIPKPSGQMISAFAASLSLAPHEIIMVGDNRHDMEEARNGMAGLAIGVLSGACTREDLISHADHVLDDIAALPSFLQENYGR